MNVAIIPAGGQGRRMGAPDARPKQFLELDGIPLIVHTLRQFELCPDINKVIVALPAAEVAAGSFSALISEYQLTKVMPPVAGAAERQDSIFCALTALARDEQLHAATEFVAIHDAVRPFVTSALISATIAAAQKYGGALAALPATDTIKEVENNCVVRTLMRARIWQAQTPQTFRYRDILSAHERAQTEKFFATDDAMLAEWQGLTVAVVEGLADNIKITKPADLAIAEMILARRRAAALLGENH